MDLLANVATLALAQERLHDLGVPRFSGSEEADEEWEKAVEEFKELEEEIDSQSVLNERFIAKNIVNRNEEQGLALDREFFKNESGNIEGVVSVTLGDLSGTRVNRPEGSKLHRNVLVNSTKKGTGWHVYMEEGKWYHLGGDERGPILYFLEFRKGKGGARGKEGWYWTKCKDQTKARALYLDMGFDKSS